MAFVQHAYGSIIYPNTVQVTPCKRCCCIYRPAGKPARTMVFTVTNAKKPRGPNLRACLKAGPGLKPCCSTDPRKRIKPEAPLASEAAGICRPPGWDGLEEGSKEGKLFSDGGRMEQDCLAIARRTAIHYPWTFGKRVYIIPILSQEISAEQPASHEFLAFQRNAVA